jgi:hypothetical protein
MRRTEQRVSARVMASFNLLVHNWANWVDVAGRQAAAVSAPAIRAAARSYEQGVSLVLFIAAKLAVSTPRTCCA